MIGGRTVLAFSTLTARDYGGFRCLNDAGAAVARVDLSGIGGDGIYFFRFESAVAMEPRSSAPGASLVAGPVPFGAVPLMLRYAIPEAGRVTITAFDVGGRAVRTLLDVPADRNGTLRWNGEDSNGRPPPSGVYFAHLESPEETVVRRVVKARRHGDPSAFRSPSSAGPICGLIGSALSGTSRSIASRTSRARSRSPAPACQAASCMSAAR